MPSLRERAANANLMSLGRDSDYQVKDGETIKKIPKAMLYSLAQVRTEFDQDALQELAENIKQNGQQMPIIVHPVDQTNKFLIHQGERRWRAIQLIDDLETVDCIVRSSNTLFQQLSENVLREALTPYEIAIAIANLKQSESINSIEVSKRLGKSKVWTSRYESINKMDSAIVNLLKSKNVLDINTITELQRASKIDFEKTLDFVTRHEVISRDLAIKFKSKLESTNDNKTTESLKKYSPSHLLVEIDGQKGFVMTGSIDAKPGTIDVKIGKAVVNFPLVDVYFIGYNT